MTRRLVWASRCFPEIARTTPFMNLGDGLLSRTVGLIHLVTATIASGDHNDGIPLLALSGVFIPHRVGTYAMSGRAVAAVVPLFQTPSSEHVLEPAFIKPRRQVEDIADNRRGRADREPHRRPTAQWADPCRVIRAGRPGRPTWFGGIA
jgi:hypothetical protein